MFPGGTALLYVDNYGCKMVVQIRKHNVGEEDLA
jgi:hypothetical protein